MLASASPPDPTHANHPTRALGSPGRGTAAVNTRNSGDAGQRLSPEPQRLDPDQVGNGAELGRGVSHEGQGEVLGLDAGPVVDYQDALQPSAIDLDRNAPRPGVDAVLNQLLDDRRRPLDDFAGGDSVGDHLVKAGDPHVVQVVVIPRRRRQAPSGEPGGSGPPGGSTGRFPSARALALAGGAR